LFCHSWVFDDREKVIAFMPCPPRVSFHPESIVFRRYPLVTRGYFIRNCEDKGVRNHIVAER
jgi:hypothetical protein